MALPSGKVNYFVRPPGPVIPLQTQNEQYIVSLAELSIPAFYPYDGYYFVRVYSYPVLYEAFQVTDDQCAPALFTKHHLG